MDLGIKGKRALVCAASKGLGRGCAEALAAEGVDLIINARGEDVLTEASATIQQRYGVNVISVTADITSEDGQKAVLDAAGNIDILVTNAGGPPPGNWRNWQRQDFIAAMDANALAPIALMTALVPKMCDAGWGRVVNITSVAVKSPIAVLGLSNTARTALTGYVAGLSRDVAGKGVVINNLLPGFHATDRIAALDGLEAQTTNTPIEAVKARRVAGIPAGRYGTADEFGRACAFLCSQHAGFIIGQNLLLDGGTFASTF